MKKYTLTIGIPVFNEALNIESLINSILEQNLGIYSLEKIVVLCDGSTDGTDKIALRLANKNKIIRVVSDRRRLGKTGRVSQLFKMNESDFVIVLDGDIALYGKEFVKQLLQGFKNKNVVICAANIRAVQNKSLVGKIMNTWEEIWQQTRLNVNNGDNIFNIRGCAAAFRKSFVENITIDRAIMSYTQYLYLLARHKGLRFHFAKDSIVIFRLPNTLSEYLSTISRGDNLDKDRVAKILGSWIYDEYSTPLKNKITALWIIFLKKPLYTIWSVILIKILIRLLKKNSGVWEVAHSTKKTIIIGTES